MDRSRMLVALALVFTIAATLLSVLNISVSMNRNPYMSESSSFLTARGSGIAVIDIRGVIQDGYYGPVAADKVIDQLSDAHYNPAILGIILNINSPGGAVGATKKIYDKVREVSADKAVVAVITDVAASGGYYIACGSDRIFAYKGSVIGSIGVISIRPDVSGLLEKYGVKVTAIKAGAFKDMSYPFRAITNEERQIYNNMLADMYNLFKHDVREGRKQSIETVESWSGGQVYSGQKAVSLQMIDANGGMKEAIAWIAKEAKRAPDDMKIYKPKRDFMDKLMNMGVVQNHINHNIQKGFESPAMYLYSGSPLAADGIIKAVLHNGGL